MQNNAFDGQFTTQDWGHCAASMSCEQYFMNESIVL